ncbi:hypothetical protein [Paenibacillus puerhi]|uniref:hypothetical protein n=1 Tax=Paenibacillus puerhi TaxID=2692622 RepID=UPI00135A2FEA|nr:hypothetical protein [Paenibacillus puerhi]
MYSGYLIYTLYRLTVKRWICLGLVAILVQGAYASVTVSAQREEKAEIAPQRAVGGEESSPEVTKGGPQELLDGEDHSDDVSGGQELAAGAGQTGMVGSSKALARSTDSIVHVTVISLPGLSFLELEPERLAAYPALRSLARDSDAGAMNVRLASKGIASVYATWGAGSPADAKEADAGNGKRLAPPGFLWPIPLLGSAVRPEPPAAFASLSLPHVSGRIVSEEADGRSSWTIPGIGRLRARNKRGGYEAAPGKLGELLKGAGIQTGIWRLEETPIAGAVGKPAKSFAAALMLMDGQGNVSDGRYARLGEVNPQLQSSWSRTAEASRIPEEANGYVPRGTLNVWEYDGISRAYASRSQQGEEAFRSRLNAAWNQADRLVAQVRSASVIRSRQQPEERFVIWLLSPEPNPDAVRKKKLLTPVLRWDPDRSAPAVGTAVGVPGLLSSATTYREGIVAAVDVAPTLLAEFGLAESSWMIGQPIRRLLPIVNTRQPGVVLSKTVKEAKEPLPRLLEEIDRLSGIYRLRPPLLYGLAVYEISIMLLGLGAGAIWIALGWNRGWLRGLSLLLQSILWAPAILVGMGWAWGSPARWMLISVLIAAIGAAGWRGSRISVGPRSALVWIMALTGTGVSLLIMGDGWSGSSMMKRSVLGYDAMIGARYYGIGNECMGVLLGASLLGLSAWLELMHGRRRRNQRRLGPVGPAKLAPACPAPVAPAPPGWRAAWPALAVGSLTAGALAAPAVGANAGGALAAAAAFGVLAARLAAGGPLRWRRLSLALAVPVAAALAGLWLLNAAAPPAPAGGSGSAAAAIASAAEPGGGSLRADAGAGHSTHIGRAFASLRQGRWDHIGAMVTRKLAMNVHLLQVSAWSEVLLTGLFVMAALVLRPKGRLRAWERRYPFLMHGCYANVLGSFAALALNDSGIVAAAAMIVYSCVPLLLLRLQEGGA